MVRRCIWVLLLAMGVFAACSGAAAPTTSPVPSADGGPVTTAEQAVDAVIAHEPRLEGIMPRDPDMIGQSSWYEVAPASGVGAFLVAVTVGWGDCPSGCIDEHTWLYAVAPDGTVTLQRESGDAVPPSAWPSAPAADASMTGLQLSAIAGPTCPVETVGSDPACAVKPVPNVTALIVGADGRVEEKVVLDAAGQRFIALEPGNYVVDAEGLAGFMNGPETQHVTVEPGRVTDVTLAFDTGIR